MVPNLSVAFRTRVPAAMIALGVIVAICATTAIHLLVEQPLTRELRSLSGLRESLPWHRGVAVD
jgi:peptidoglycan/LPS O-acetylase OafA/YrhL